MKKIKYPFSKTKPVIQHPNYPKPFQPEIYAGKYVNSLLFQNIKVNFWISRSKMYPEAQFLCSLMPNNTLATESNGYVNSFTIDSINQCYIYQDIWRELEFCIRSWSLVECYVNDELCYLDELFAFWLTQIQKCDSSNLEIIDLKTERKNRNNIWIHEKQLYSIVQNILPNENIIYHFRAKWLDNLELDIFIETLNIAIEYQGIQHYEVVEHWGGTDGLAHRKFNDERKKKLCEQHNTTLIYFDYTDVLTAELVFQRLKPFL